MERSEERLAKAVTELAGQSQRADAAIKKRQQLENLNRYNIVYLNTVKEIQILNVFTQGSSSRMLKSIILQCK